MSSFPAVATVLGVSQEVAESGPLLATLAIDPSMMAAQRKEPVEIRTGDPVTQAVVDNIIGKLPTKKEPVTLRCEVCNVTVFSHSILQTHYSGAKHIRKLKGQALVKEISNSPNSTFISTGEGNGTSDRSEFTCKICNVRVNSYQQLQQHLTGSKHTTKALSSQSNTMQVSGGTDGVVSVDIRLNRLYCAACNVHVNSDLQLHQHITSTKHANKVNGRVQPASYTHGVNGRGQPTSSAHSVNNHEQPTSYTHGALPYTRRPGRGRAANSYRSGPIKNVSGWSASSTSMNLSGSWPQQTINSNKNFVSGGMLYDQ